MNSMNVFAANPQMMLVHVPIHSSHPSIPIYPPQSVQCIPIKPAIQAMNNAFNVPLFVCDPRINNLNVVINPRPQQLPHETYTTRSYAMPGSVVTPHLMYTSHQTVPNLTSVALTAHPLTPRSIKPPNTKTVKSTSPSKPIKPVWTCSLCSKTFTRKSNLKQHLKIHSNTCDFICHFCSRGFR
eukprot:480472_1